MKKKKRENLAIEVRGFVSIDQSLNFFTNDRWVKLVPHELPSVIHLSLVICKLLHENENLPDALI